MTYGEFKAMWAQMTDVQRQPVRDKANWEHMTLWAVLNEWPELRPRERGEQPTWKQERPAWCPHQDCVFCRRSQDALCGGRLLKPEPHDGDENTHRLCVKAGEVFDLQVNNNDLGYFRWILDALDGKVTSWLSQRIVAPLPRGYSEIVQRKIPDAATAIRRLNTRIDDGCFLEADEYAIDLLIQALAATADAPPEDRVREAAEGMVTLADMDRIPAPNACVWFNAFDKRIAALRAALTARKEG